MGKGSSPNKGLYWYEATFHCGNQTKDNAIFYQNLTQESFEATIPENQNIPFGFIYLVETISYFS